VVAGFADPAKGTALGLQAAALAGAPCRAAAALPRDLDGAAVFVYVTYSEGLGSAILLAMSAGVPVVASRVGGVPEIVRDGVTGLASPNTPDQIAACIRRLLDQPALADRLARQARQMVEQEFSAELMIERTLHVYRQVLQ
jgi:glycosyltransferase involved in cell wall biosynthesis